jgi:hypothetical protein
MLHFHANFTQALQGLAYMHEELHVSHGEVKSDNVFLTLHGQVKLGECRYLSLLLFTNQATGNVAMSLLHQRTGTELEDVKCVGRILKEVMEPGDFKKNPSSRVLKYPADWSAHVRTFLAATQTSKLRDLQNVRCPRPLWNDSADSVACVSSIFRQRWMSRTVGFCS